MTIRILQLTDCHLMADPRAELKGICTRALFERVLGAVRSRQGTLDRLIVTGDLTHDEQLATYQSLRELLAPWLPRLRLIPGNHDHRERMRQAFPERIQPLGERNVFVEDLGNWRLIGLDSHVPGELHGQVGDEQLAWQEEQLATHSGPVALFLHHPPMLVGSQWLDRIGLQDAAEFLALVRRHANVRAIVCGHVHQERTVCASSAESPVTIFTSPSTGVQFRSETISLEVAPAPPGFRVLELHSDGRIVSWVERVP